MYGNDDFSLYELFESCRNEQTHDANRVDEGFGKSLLATIAGLGSMATTAFGAAPKPDHPVVTGPTGVVQKAKLPYEGFSAYQAINILARTIYGEARGEGTNGMDAVASAIWTRAGGDPNKMPRECLKPSQFSCWDKVPLEKRKPGTYSMQSYVGSTWDYATSLAKDMLSKKFSPKGDYTHYYANKGKNKVKKTPYWAKERSGTQIGNQMFFTKNEMDRKLTSSTRVTQSSTGAKSKPKVSNGKTASNGKPLAKGNATTRPNSVARAKPSVRQSKPSNAPRKVRRRRT